ncbi:MAG: aldehyde dehydrogenase family protein [Ottowia sp.]
MHVIRFQREQLDALVDGINATGYGLTFGMHSRIDETIAHLSERVQAGNIYVNRNVIGAVVGVQPFGGMGLSGTGPKAGGPLYLHRLVQGAAERRPGRAAARRGRAARTDAGTAGAAAADGAARRRCRRWRAPPATPR